METIWCFDVISEISKIEFESKSRSYGDNKIVPTYGMCRMIPKAISIASTATQFE